MGLNTTDAFPREEYINKRAPKSSIEIITLNSPLLHNLHLILSQPSLRGILESTRRRNEAINSNSRSLKPQRNVTSQLLLDLSHQQRLQRCDSICCTVIQDKKNHPQRLISTPTVMPKSNLTTNAYIKMSVMFENADSLPQTTSMRSSNRFRTPTTPFRTILHRYYGPSKACFSYPKVPEPLTQQILVTKGQAS